MPTTRQKLLLLLALLPLPVAATGYQLWAHAAVPTSADILGVVGNVGEWEMTATIARDGDKRELAGAMSMKHVGWCSQDGPLEKTGQLRVKMARLSSNIVATVQFDGVACSFEGSLSDAYTGIMTCPDRKPVQMLVWMR